MPTSSNVTRSTLLIAVLIAFTLSAASDQSERVAIVSIVGDWKYNGTSVFFGEALPEGAACLFGSDGSVVLQSESKHVTRPFVCEERSRDSGCRDHDSYRCAVILDPKQWKTTEDKFGSLWASVKQLLTGNPEKYMVAASRGLEPGLDDAVVSWQGPNLDLAPAFRDMSEGQYWIKLDSVEMPAAKKIFELHFVPHSRAIVTVSAVHPGLYRLLLVDQSGGPGGSDSWILVTAPENYSTISQAFQRALDSSANWPQDMDPSAVRALLRAYLESLAGSGSKNNP
jgi:hypothetical protein